MHIAYLINQYPKVSHSFVRREIVALERLGLKITRISLRGWDLELADGADERERQLTRYVIRDGIIPLFISSVVVAFCRPFKFFLGLILAMRMSRRAERPLPVHIAYLFEACHILKNFLPKDVKLVHAHFGTNSAEVAMLVRELGGPPYSLTVHGPKEFENVNSTGLSEKLRRASFVAAVSSYGRSQMCRLLEHASWDKISVVRCGLDEFFLSAPAIPVPQSPRLVCVGRLCEQKGQLLLIEAVSRLSDAGYGFELVLAGDGEMRTEIESMIDQRGLAKRIRITGWIDAAQVKREIETSRAMILPSFAEGLPVVIMEAMALGRPVISTYVAGIPELVSSETGWLVPAGDIDGLVEAMKECMTATPERLTQMGHRGRARVHAKHDVQKNAVHLKELFASAINRQ